MRLRYPNASASFGRSESFRSSRMCLVSLAAACVRAMPVPSRIGHAAFHRPFLLEVLEVAVDRGNCQHGAVASIAHQAIAPLYVALDLELVPLLGMTDIVDWHVIMLAPEERDVGKSLALSEDILRYGLTLALGNDPMLGSTWHPRPYQPDQRH